LRGAKLLLADLGRVFADDVGDEAAHSAAHVLHSRADALLQLGRHAPGHGAGALAAEALEGLDVASAPLAGFLDDLEFFGVGLIEYVVEDGLKLVARHGPSVSLVAARAVKKGPKARPGYAASLGCLAWINAA
jgi:hypothetical protein